MVQESGQAEFAATRGVISARYGLASQGALCRVIFPVKNPVIFFFALENLNLASYPRGQFYSAVSCPKFISQ